MALLLYVIPKYCLEKKTMCSDSYLDFQCLKYKWIKTFSTTFRRKLRLMATSRYLLDVPKVRTVTMQKRAFAHAGPTLWNTIPEALRSRVMNCTLDTVKKHLKSFLFVPSVQDNSLFFVLLFLGFR